MLIEEFVPGREVSFIAIDCDGPPLEAFVEISVDGEPDYFDNRLLDATAKLEGLPARTLRRIDADLGSDDLVAIRRLLDALGHFGAVRIDGKLHDGGFHMLGVAPVPASWLGPDGDLAYCFRPEGFDRTDVLHAILASALQAPAHRQLTPAATAHWPRPAR